MNYLILGAGAAGLAAIEAIRNRDANGSITLCSAESTPPYTLCALPDLLAGDIDEEALRAIPTGRLEELGVDHRRSWQAQAIESHGDGWSVRSTNHGSLTCDRLLIATGSVPLLPTIPGLDRPGLFTHLDLSGCQALSSALPRADRIAIIGGGFLGVEVAQAIVGWAQRQKQKLEVILVEMEDRILASMLDVPRSQIAGELLEETGVTIRLNSRIIGINGQGNTGPVNGLELEDGTSIDCDLVVMAAGVRPNLDWLGDHGPKIGASGGLIVDARMETDQPGLFAAGDLVEAWAPDGLSRGLRPTWTNAARQGRIAGMNMATMDDKNDNDGENPASGPDPADDPGDRYTGWDSFNVIHIGEIPLVSCGEINDLPSTVEAVDSPEGLPGMRSKPIDTTLYIDEGRLIGLCSRELPANIGHLHTLIREGKGVAGPDRFSKEDHTGKAHRLYFESSLLARRKVRPVGTAPVSEKPEAGP